MNTSNINNAAVDSKITASTVPEHYRLGFLPRHFGNLMIVVEHGIYEQLSGLATDYTGGYWEFVDLDNGGCFMHPSQDTVHVVAPNGFEGTVSGQVAGIIATLYALSHLSMTYRDDDRLADTFHNLRDFALEHAQAHEILAAID